MNNFELFEIIDSDNMTDIDNIDIQTKNKKNRRLKKQIIKNIEYNQNKKIHHFNFKVLKYSALSAVLFLVAGIFAFLTFMPKYNKPDNPQPKPSTYQQESSTRQQEPDNHKTSKTAKKITEFTIDFAFRYYNVENGFFSTNGEYYDDIDKATPDSFIEKDIFIYQNGNIVAPQKKHCSGTYRLEEIEVTFSFDYVLSSSELKILSSDGNYYFDVFAIPNNLSQAIFAVTEQAVVDVPSQDEFGNRIWRLVKKPFQYVFIIDLTTAKLTPLNINNHPSSSTKIQMSPDMRYLLYVDKYYEYYIYDINKKQAWQVQTTIPLGDYARIYSTQWINDNILVFQNSYGASELYDASKKEFILQPFTDETEIIFANNSIYQVVTNKNGYLFQNLLSDEKFEIEKGENFDSQEKYTLSEHDYYITHTDDCIDIYNLKSGFRDVISIKKEEFNNYNNIGLNGFIGENQLFITTSMRYLESDELKYHYFLVELYDEFNPPGNISTDEKICLTTYVTMPPLETPDIEIK